MTSVGYISSHFAQIIIAENKNLKAIWDAKLVRNTKNIEVYTTAIMSDIS